MLSDVVLDLLPVYRFVASYRSILWNPLQGAGTPLLANVIYGLLFPLNWLYFLVPFDMAIGAIAIVKTELAGLFMYKFLKDQKTSWTGSLFGSFAFMFSGYITVWLQWPHSSTYIWTPLIFMFILRIMRSQSIFRNTALLSISLMFSVLGGHIETALHLFSFGILFSLFFAAFRLRLGPRLILRSIGCVILGLCAGLLFSAIQLVPFIEFFMAGNIGATRFGLGSNPFHEPFWSMIALLVPNFFGNPSTGTFWALGWSTNYNEMNGGYVGVATLILAAYALTRKTVNDYVWCFAFVGTIALMISKGVPGVFDLVTRLPFFAIAANFRLLFIFAFSAIVLASRGIDLISTTTSIRRTISILVLISCVMFGVMLTTATQYYTSLRVILGMFSWYVLVFIAFSISVAALTIISLWCTRIKNWRGYKTRTLVRCLLLLILVLDMLAFAYSYVPQISPASNYPLTPAIRFLQEDKSIHRVIGLGMTALPNTFTFYGIADARALFTDIPIDYYRYGQSSSLGTLADPALMLTSSLNASSIQWRLLDLVNVKYVITAPDGAALAKSARSRFSLVYSGGDAKIYLNHFALPRAFITHRTEIISRSQMISRLLDPRFNMTSTILVETGHSQIFPEEPSYNESTSITYYGPTDMRITVNTGADGYLFVSDQYFEGWQAGVDGHTTEILRANYVFRAIRIQSGRHIVSLTYRPLSLLYGSVISVLSIGVMMVATFRTKMGGLIIQLHKRFARNSWRKITLTE
jgi:hypothetical protein